MRDTLVQKLMELIESTHHCHPTYLETVPVRQTVRGGTQWSQEVSVFSLTGHPHARRCYGWIGDGGSGSGTRKMVIVLHEGPIDSPMLAVQASFVAAWMKQQN